MLIIARTDARATHSMEEAIKRGKLAKEAGADIVFPEAMESEDEFRQYADAVGRPLLANMTEFGKSPYLNVQQFHELGYAIVIFPVTAMRVAMKSVEAVLSDIKKTGTQTDWLERMQTRRELYDLIEYDDYEEMDRQLSADTKSQSTRH